MSTDRDGGRSLPAEGVARVITALVAKGAEADRVAVYLDGCFAFDLAAVVAREAALVRGDLLGVERQTALEAQDAPYRARNLALSVLSRREMSRKEVATKLRQRGLSDDVIEDTVSWLEERGYVDDRRFASAYVTERVKAGWGRRRITGGASEEGRRRRNRSRRGMGQDARGAGHRQRRRDRGGACP